MNTVQAPQTGEQIDRELLEFADAEDSENNDKILYIRHGHIAFDTEENLFTVVSLN